MGRAVEPSPPSLAPAEELESAELPDGGELRELDLSEALVDRSGRAGIASRRLRIDESELRGLGLEGSRLEDLMLRDCRLVNCDLSNVSARRGQIRRIESAESKWIGFALIEGELSDAAFVSGSMFLSSFAHSTLRRVRFAGVNLREAAFVSCDLESVVFEDCELAGADFRGASLRNCAIRGCSLEGVVGVESMRGLAMPWPELLDSAGPMAAALGIEVDEPGED